MTDPCVGQGTALQLVTSDAPVGHYGIELDAERARISSSKGIETIQGNTFDAIAEHHLPGKLRRQCAAEIRRVLKPGGRGPSISEPPLLRREASSLIFTVMVTSVLPKSSPSSVRQVWALSRAAQWESATCSLSSRRPHAASNLGPFRPWMEVMTGHNRMLTRRWLLLALAVVLISSHALVLRYVLQHKSLSAAMVTGMMILVVMTHLGILSRLYGLFRRRSRQ